MILPVFSTTRNGIAPNTITTVAGDTAGATLVVVAAVYYPAGGAHAVTDSKGNTWTALSESVGAGGVRLYYNSAPVVGAGHTFTLASEGNIFPTIAVLALSGTHATPVGGQNTAVSSASVTLQPGSVTPAIANSVVITGINVFTGTSLLANGGYTVVASSFVDSLSLGGGLAYLIQTTPVATNPTWSWTTANDAAAVIAAFKPLEESSSLSSMRGSHNTATKLRRLMLAKRLGMLPRRISSMVP